MHNNCKRVTFVDQIYGAFTFDLIDHKGEFGGSGSNLPPIAYNQIGEKKQAPGMTDWGAGSAMDWNAGGAMGGGAAPWDIQTEV